ncbi:MAG: ubiquinol-cytochrome c reductase cytochrome c subunit [Actinomycetota bacterium]|nr:ubiquinol-cytochrome c reductase cytochrome c subunit [Actinomycetota bacterium]
MRRLTVPWTGLTRRRRHRFAPLVVLAAALGVTGGLYTALAPSPHAEAASGVSTASIDQGRGLFLRNCSSCHGLNAEGSSDGPTLIGVGAAAVDFQVGTGRMPAANVGPQIVKKRPSFDAQQTAALAAYVASLAPGPTIPDKSQLDYTNSDIAKGGEIYRTNCAMCHNFAGSGGALTLGKFAPALRGTSPRHMYEAMITGPQSMPVFSDSTMPAKDKREIIAFLRNAAKEPSPGGLSLGKIGPVSEGGVGWLFGLGALIACAVWLGAKAR